jgi:hypothetical protein
MELVCNDNLFWKKEDSKVTATARWLLNFSGYFFVGTFLPHSAPDDFCHRHIDSV